MTERRFPQPWTIEKIPGGLKVCDATGQSLAYVYSRENPGAAHIAKVLTEDEARRIATTSPSCRRCGKLGGFAPTHQAEAKDSVCFR